MFLRAYDRISCLSSVKNVVLFQNWPYQSRICLVRRLASSFDRSREGKWRERRDEGYRGQRTQRERDYRETDHRLRYTEPGKQSSSTEKDSESDASIKELLIYFRSVARDKLNEEKVLKKLTPLAVKGSSFLVLSKSSNPSTNSFSVPSDTESSKFITFTQLNFLLSQLIYKTKLRRYRHRSIKSFLYQCFTQTEQLGPEIENHQYELVNFLLNCGRLGCRWRDLEQSEQDLILILMNRIDKKRCEISFSFYAQYVGMLGELEFPVRPDYSDVMNTLKFHKEIQDVEIDFKDLEALIRGFGAFLTFKKVGIPEEVIPFYRRLLFHFLTLAFHPIRIKEQMAPNAEVCLIYYIFFNLLSFFLLFRSSTSQ